MEYVSVLVAAAGAYAFGAFWYMVNSKAWLAASGIECDENGRPVGGGNAAPFIISAIMAIIVAGMMRHVFGMAGIDTVAKGFMAGIGLGAFVVAPWIVTNYAYSMRPRNLTLIDGSYAIAGCTIIGVILTLF
jgi:hypothetical protein